MMLLPAKQAKFLRKAENALFINPIRPKYERIQFFWKLLVPTLQWLKTEIVNNYNLLEEEADSEIYIFCTQLFNSFDSRRSSIIPYLQKAIPWTASKLKRKLDKILLEEEPIGFTRTGIIHNIKEEFYWTVPKILYEDRYVGKVFTRGQKYIIYSILASDDSLLSQDNIATRCRMNKTTLKKRLDCLKTKMEELYGTSTRRSSRRRNASDGHIL